MPATRWTIIARLQSRDDKLVRRALDELCAQYHYPLYCYLRLRGLNHHDAEDALHDFLSKFLRLNSFQTAEEERGRLRTYLLVSLQHFLSNWSRLQSRPQEVSIETLASLNEDQELYQKEYFTEEDSPDRIFDRKWAQELMSGVIQHLQEEYVAADKGELFEALRPVLLSGGSLRGVDSTALARSLSMSTGALRVAHSRLLKDYRSMLEADVAQTVSDRESIAEEISYLKQVFCKTARN